jgi:hypothetical protein
VSIFAGGLQMGSSYSLHFSTGIDAIFMGLIDIGKYILEFTVGME